MGGWLGANLDECKGGAVAMVGVPRRCYPLPNYFGHLLFYNYYGTISETAEFQRSRAGAALYKEETSAEVFTTSRT